MSVGQRVIHRTGWIGTVTRRVGATGIVVQPDGHYAPALYSAVSFVALGVVR